MTEEIKQSESEKKKEDWMNSKWRPMMGWMYMVVCTFDFMIAPILWSILQSLSKGQVNVQWQPLTLQGAGLFHISMGAVLGLAAYGRTQEKLAGANNGGAGGTTYVAPALTTQPASTPAPSFGGTPNGGFNASPAGASTFSAPAAGGFGAPAASAPTTSGFGTVTAGFGGKPAPVQPEQPAI